jgi:F-type H+-transporting ATPase subunit gamma
MNFPTGNINFKIASSIAHQILNSVPDCDRIILLYNEFKNVISQVQRKMELMPRKQFLKQYRFVVKH